MRITRAEKGAIIELDEEEVICIRKICRDIADINLTSRKGNKVFSEFSKRIYESLLSLEFQDCTRITKRKRRPNP